MRVVAARVHWLETRRPSPQIIERYEMYRIRDYHPGDAKELDVLAVQSFAQYARAYDDWPGLRAKIRKMSALAEFSDVFVAECDGRLIGAVAYLRPGMPKADFFRPEWAVMRMLVVVPKARGRGVGRALVGICLERARADGATFFALHTSPIMRAALNIYQRLGFQWSYPVPPIHGVAYDVYTLRLDEYFGNTAEVPGIQLT